MNELKKANDSYFLKDYKKAKAFYLKFLSSNPRAFWIRFNVFLCDIKMGDYNEAYKVFKTSFLNGSLNEDLVEKQLDVLKEILVNKAPYISTPLDVYQVIDSHKKKVITPIRRISKDRKYPSGYNFDLQLNKIIGNINQYEYISSSIEYLSNNYKLIRKKLLIVKFVKNTKELEQLLKIVNAQKNDYFEHELLIIDISNGVVRSFGELLVYNYNFLKPLDQLNSIIESIQYDIICFFPEISSFKISRFMLERIVKYYNFTDLTVFALEYDKNIEKEEITLNIDSKSSWEKELYPFRKVGFSNLTLTREQFESIGGFYPNIFDGAISFKNLAYRLYLSGKYFIPALGVYSANDVNSIKGTEAFEDYCAAHWYRKTYSKKNVLPKVSIYIPSYNNAEYIVQAINSALEQTFQDLEVCVYDDGSTDETKKVLTDKYSKNSKVKVIFGPNGGIGYASNKAINMCSGIYIAQLDSDDKLKPTAIAELVEYLDNNRKVGCVYSSAERIDSTGNYIKDEYNFPIFSREKMMMTSIIHHLRMFRSQIWHRTEGFREDIENAVDYDIFLKISEITECYHYDKVLYQRRWHGSNTSIVNVDKQTENTLKVQKMSLMRQGLEHYFGSHFVGDQSKRTINYYYLNNPQTRIFFWPDYTTSNPYQKFMYSSLLKDKYVLSGDIDSAIKSLKDNGKEVYFHLHWLNKIADLKKDSKENIIKLFESFLKKLHIFSDLGGRIVWTIHNESEHDSKFIEIENYYRKKIGELSYRIHLHNEKDFYQLIYLDDSLYSKIRVIEHGSFIPFYPNYLSKEESREMLGIPNDSFVICFTGQIKPYKGIELLISSFKKFSETNSNTFLILAGRIDKENQIFKNKVIESDKIILMDEFLENEEIQKIYNVSDISVFPYKKILTSGSAILSMGFGVPCLLPTTNMTKDLTKDVSVDLLLEDLSEQTIVKKINMLYRIHKENQIDSIGKECIDNVKKLNWDGFNALFETDN
ncbi:glycosyltransferase [Psychrobacter sp. 1U2]|uniref:glycosyltransferase n=1 Tax=Psychrobacter sp. 1U2 TaxID=3453577 RepID=UPI003F485128